MLPVPPEQAVAVPEQPQVVAEETDPLAELDEMLARILASHEGCVACERGFSHNRPRFEPYEPRQIEAKARAAEIRCLAPLIEEAGRRGCAGTPGPSPVAEPRRRRSAVRKRRRARS